MGTGQALKDGRGTEYSTANESKLIGYFGRLNYSYKGKYMFAASLRHEGSTKFGADHKWGNFPSVSAAWNIKGEQFLEDTCLLYTSYPAKATPLLLSDDEVPATPIPNHSFAQSPYPPFLPDKPESSCPGYR